MVLAVAGTAAEAGPIVSHPLTEAAGEPGGQGGAREVSPDAVPTMPAALTFHDLGFLPAQAVSALGPEVDVPGSLWHPPGLSSGTGRRWAVAARTTRRHTDETVGGTDGKKIPEPASILLLVTGLVGFTARRRLLRVGSASARRESGSTRR